MRKNILNEEELRARLLKPLDRIHAENKTPNDNLLESNFIRTKNDPTTLMKYITNPTGKGSAYVANRAAIKQGLNMQYIKLLREHRRSFYAVPYIYPNGDILFYVKVPSEFYKTNKISYDVLFLLKYDKDRKRYHWEMNTYSNSPSFIFTYAYVYNQHGMLIDKLKSKIPSEALSRPPEVRNPIQSFGFEKSTYIAARYLYDGRCIADEYINRFSKIMDPITESKLFSSIADPELLVSIYQHAQYESRKTHRKELSANEKQIRRERLEKYEKHQQENRPKSVGFIFKRSPRAKLDARSAQKKLDFHNKKK